MHFRPEKITIYPNGHDEWIFVPTLVMRFPDGTSLSFTANSALDIDEDDRVGYVNYGGYSHP
ncbi:hypothetical protein HDC91_001081 [Mucilaginibacter sp. AK015]|nr:hypothetical protein [Mucilaginibacter sp. AK015]